MHRTMRVVVAVVCAATLAAAVGQGADAQGPTSVPAFTEVVLPAAAQATPTWGLSWGSVREAATTPDKYPDLFVSRHDRGAVLFETTNGSTWTAHDVDPLAGSTSGGGPNPERLDAHGAAWADFDNDFDPDLYQISGREEDRQFNVMYRNNADAAGQAPLRCQLSDQGQGFVYPACTTTSTYANVELDETSGRTPLWFDTDHDGDLDLYLFNRWRGAPAVASQLAISNVEGGPDTFANAQPLRMGNTTGDSVTNEYGQIIAAGPLLQNPPTAPPVTPRSPCVVANSDEGFPAYNNPLNPPLPNNGGRCDGLSFAGRPVHVSDTAVADFDLDGDLDIYLTRQQPRSGARQIGSNTRYRNTVIAKLRPRDAAGIPNAQVLYLRIGAPTGPAQAAGAIVGVGPEFGTNNEIPVYVANGTGFAPYQLPAGTQTNLLNTGTGTPIAPGAHCGLTPTERREILPSTQNTRYYCLDTPTGTAIGTATDTQIGEDGQGIYIRRVGTSYETTAFVPPTVQIFEANVLFQYVAATVQAPQQDGDTPIPSTFDVLVRDPDTGPQSCKLNPDDPLKPFCAPFQTSALPGKYFRNTGTSYSNENLPGAGTTNSATSCHSVTAVDVDNDTDTDLYLACNRNVDPRGTDDPDITTLDNASNILLVNNRAQGGPHQFVQIQEAETAENINLGAATGRTTAPLPTWNNGLSESTASADIDRDGWMDLALTNGHEGGPFNEGPIQLFRNQLGASSPNKALEINLTGRVGYANRDGIGTVVVVEVLDTAGVPITLRRYVALQDGGVHRYSQDQDIVHVGLGTPPAGASVRIRTWWQQGGLNTNGTPKPLACYQRIVPLNFGAGSVQHVFFQQGPNPPTTPGTCVTS